MMWVVIDANVKAYATVKLDGQLAAALSLVVFWLWTQQLTHSLLFSLLVEQQEARPDAETCRRAARVKSGFHMQ